MTEPYDYMTEMSQDFYIETLKEKIKELELIKQAAQELFEEIRIVGGPYLSSHEQKLVALKKLVEDIGK